MKDILLKDFKPRSLLKVEEHVPERAKFPVIDAHNHLFAETTADDLVRIMDAVGVEAWVNVSGNATLPYENNTYTIKRVPFERFAENYLRRFPSRFAAFTMAEFARWDESTLFRNGEDFARRCIKTLENDVRSGACGLKVTKELGLKFRDASGKMVPVNDERLYPVWRRAGELGLPVLIHVSDPIGFFLAPDETNEHLPVLQEFPAWSFHGSHFNKDELLAQRNRMIGDHPKVTFILPHIGNHPENLAAVSQVLDAYPNVMIDISARLDELGRQPYTARRFLIRYQDRVLFGTDMPARPDIYRCHFRFFETFDEYFETPDYIGRFGKSRWRVCGLGLPDDVLRKLYRGNAARIIPAFRR